MKKLKPSRKDVSHLKLIRQNVIRICKYCGIKYGNKKGLLLDIAPQIHEGARPYFSRKVLIKTLDINQKNKPDIAGDICKKNRSIKNKTFDIVVCTEVLEHTLDPFGAMREIHRILKTGGLLVVSAPFDFRIHGPLPDCWRFTIHGWRELLRKFKVLKVMEVKNSKRNLMPVHYGFLAEKI